MNIEADDLTLGAYRGISSGNPSNEDVYRQAFHAAQGRFGREHLSLSNFSHQDVLAKMYEVQANPDYKQSYRGEIWKAFDAYTRARENYLSVLEEPNLQKVMDEVRAIDPALLGENRYEESAGLIKRIALDFFYGLKRFFTSNDTLARYQGRIEILQEEFEKSSQGEKVVEVFNRSIHAANHPQSVQEIDEFLTYMDFLDESDPLYSSFQEAKGRVLSELEKTIHKSHDLIFNRPLVGPQFAPEMYYMADFAERNQHLIPIPELKHPEIPPLKLDMLPSTDEDEEFFTPRSTSSDEFFSCESPSESPREDERDEFIGRVEQLPPISIIPDERELARMNVNAMLDTRFFDHQMIASLIKERVIPMEQIERVDVNKEYTAMRISFKGPLEGRASQVDSPGMRDFATARLVAQRENTVQFDTNLMRFDPGALKMGIVIRDYDFYLRGAKIGPTIWGVDTGLQALKSSLGYYSNGLQVTLDIHSLQIDDLGNVVLGVTPNFEERIALVTDASHPPEMIQGYLQKLVKKVKMTQEEFAATFAHVEWTGIEG